jgi:hypothetical protein
MAQFIYGGLEVTLPNGNLDLYENERNRQDYDYEEGEDSSLRILMGSNKRTHAFYLPGQWLSIRRITSIKKTVGGASTGALLLFALGRADDRGRVLRKVHGHPIQGWP